MFDSLRGLKTYIVAAIAVIAAVLGFLNDQLTLLQALQAIGLAIGLGGNRSVLQAAAIINGPFSSSGINVDRRALVTYAGIALTILTAILAGINGQQEPAVTIAAILGALGLNFLGTGAKKVADGTAVTKPTIK